jgi:hypothetical protein
LPARFIIGVAPASLADPAAAMPLPEPAAVVSADPDPIAEPEPEPDVELAFVVSFFLQPDADRASANKAIATRMR